MPPGADALALNAPYGARCFLTRPPTHLRRDLRVLMRLMALGAFRRGVEYEPCGEVATVLMHLMALGAFRPRMGGKYPQDVETRLNAPYGARCFLTG